MCGFAGIVAWKDAAAVDPDRLARMSARIAHRGPDGEGIWLSDSVKLGDTSPRAGLAHRRLAVIDPDPRANQPLGDGRGRWLVYNGELYNFRELRRQLSHQLPDFEWRTDGDTEVVLAAYIRWGPSCVDHFNGMYAFAIWDEPAGQLYLARDRMGQKPLYYARTDSRVVFASELRALLAAGQVDDAIDYASLTQFLRWGYINAPRTIYRGVAHLPPGHTLLLDAHGGEPARYFDPNAPNAELGEKNAAQAKQLVEQAVQRQLVADVPVGCLLSGGIDSSIVAWCMTRSRPDVQTFSIGFDDARYDETVYAAAVAQSLKTRHRTFTVRPNVAEDLPRLAEVFGEPFADSSALPTHYLARATRQYVKVALGGDGGDELFGGYDRYRAMRIAESLSHLGFAARWSALLPHGHPKSRRERIKRLLASVGKPPLERYMGYVSLFDAASLARLVRAEMWPTDLNISLEPPGFIFDGPARDAMQASLALDRITYLPGDLLTKVDRASMLHNLEVRSPFMDHELVAFAARLSPWQLMRGGSKRMLREAFAADLPGCVFNRNKMGFAVPIGDWLRGELRPMLHDLLFAADAFARSHFSPEAITDLMREHDTHYRDHSQRLYALLMLELWWRSQKSRAAVAS